MKLLLVSIGKPNEKMYANAIEEFSKRINRYHGFQLLCIASKAIPSSPIADQLDKEADQLQQLFLPDDIIVILDDKGTHLTTVAFAQQLQKWMNLGAKRIVFIIGGAYGIADKIKQKANFSLSISLFTFPHQLVRLIFTEQLYRAFSVLANEKYHHD